MRRFVYPIGPAEAGRTVKSLLKGKGYSSRALARLKKDPLGLLRNGAHVRTVDLLAEGDRLEVTLREEENTYARCDTPVPILWEDEDFVAFDKPAGMPCHTSWAHPADTLANVFAAHCDRLGMQAPFRVLGRLDQDTTGCVLVAKNQLAASLLVARPAWVKKVYLAAVSGAPQPPAGRVDAPIARAGEDSGLRRVDPAGQRAVTNYRTLRPLPGGRSLLAFSLETGRTHQIRVHMAHLGHPLLGDALYGGDCAALSRQALHCAGLAFFHPERGEWVRLFAPLPADMAALCGPVGEETLPFWRQEVPE